MRVLADYILIGRESNRAEMSCHADNKLIGGFVVKKHRSPLGVQNVERCGNNLGKRDIGMERGGQLARDFQYLPESAGFM